LDAKREMSTYPKEIDRFAFRFKNYTYRPIRLCLKENQGLAATILLCCAIDLLAKFNSGNPQHRDNKTKYVSFLKEYFNSSYAPSQFYKFVRCGLVHSYSMENQYTILCRDESWARKLHLIFDKNTKKTIINPYQLLSDLQNAVKLYEEDIKTKHNKTEDFLRVHKIIPLKQQVTKWKKLKSLAEG
jgi:hypothetical protein